MKKAATAVLVASLLRDDHSVSDETNATDYCPRRAPRIPGVTARQFLRDHGSSFVCWHVTGAATDSRNWTGRTEVFGQRMVEARALMEERSYATDEFSFGSPDPSEVWVARSPEGADVICGVIPQTKTTRSSGAGGLRQDAARNNWGWLFQPGANRSFVVQSPYSTCLQTRNGGRSVDVMSEDDYTVSGKGVRAG